MEHFRNKQSTIILMIELLDKTTAYSAEARAVVAFRGTSDLFTLPDKPIAITETDLVVPWGADNKLPLYVMDQIGKSEVVGSNLLFNIEAGYGLGIKPMKRVVKPEGITYEECTDERVLAFFENNDIDGYFLEQLSDMMTFFNVFPEVIVNEAGTEIVSLRHLEATFSRWGSIPNGGRELAYHYYFSEWGDKMPDKADLVKTSVLSRYNTLDDLRSKVAKKDRRFVLQVSMPTPGRTYYSAPYWWSIFKSGWFDLSVMIPNFKKALLKNHLAVRYVIYVSDAYWEECLRLANIQNGDLASEKRVREETATKLMEFLQNEEGKGGGIIATKRFSPYARGGGDDERYIEIVPIKPEIEGGEFIEDSEEASNIISYAMGVHPSLNGATPGKTGGSLGGSDKRELYSIKQAMMRPFRDRLLKPLTLIKNFNGWDKDIVFGVPEFQFTTLDVAKSGKVESNQNPK